MLECEKVIVERCCEIVDLILKFMENYDNVNLAVSVIKSRCEVNNFFKTSEKYGHTKFFRYMVEAFTRKNPNFIKKEISLNNYIIKIVYQDGKSTDALNRIRIDATNGRWITLHFKFDNFKHIKDEIYQLGLRIANRNTRTLAEVKKCIENFKADLNKYTYKEIKEMITLNPVKVLNQKETSNSYVKVDVELHTNSTQIKDGFWIYYFIIFQEKEDMVLSDPFSLITYRQFHKRKDDSFLGRHKKYMENNKETLYPYYFNSIFYKVKNSNSYKFKKTFDFGINFYQTKGITESNNNSGNNMNINEAEVISNVNGNYSGGSGEAMNEEEVILNDNGNYSGGSDEAMNEEEVIPNDNGNYSGGSGEAMNEEEVIPNDDENYSGGSGEAMNEDEVIPNDNGNYSGGSGKAMNEEEVIPNDNGNYSGGSGEAMNEEEVIPNDNGNYSGGSCEAMNEEEVIPNDDENYSGGSGEAMNEDEVIPNDNGNYSGGSGEAMNEDEVISDDDENYMGCDEVAKDLVEFNPVLRDIQFGNISSSNETRSLDLLDIKSNNESDNDEIHNNFYENMINLSRNSLQHKNEYPSPSPSQSSTSSLLSSPIQIPSNTLSPPPKGCIDHSKIHEKH